MATLASRSVGDIVPLTLNGKAHNFIIVNQGKPSDLYDDSCDGTWLLIQDIYELAAWHDEGAATYKGSTINARLAEIVGLFDDKVKQHLKTVKVPYITDLLGTQVASGANGLSVQAFLLSAPEVGAFITEGEDAVAEDGAVLAFFKDGPGVAGYAEYNGEAKDWWTRSISKSTTEDDVEEGYVYPWFVSPDDLDMTATLSANTSQMYYNKGIRFAIVLPGDFDPYGSSTGTTPATGGHLTLTEGSSKIITGGRALIGGTGYDILSGRALIGGTGYSIVFGKPVGDLEIGASLYGYVNGVQTEFLVMHHGNPDPDIYDASCDGTWVRMKDACATQMFNQYGYDYRAEGPHSYLENTFFPSLDLAFQSSVRAVRVPYKAGDPEYADVSIGSAGLLTRAFAPSYLELGFSMNATRWGIDGAILDYYAASNNNARRIIQYNGAAVRYGLRSAANGTTYIVNTTGTQYSPNAPSARLGIVPMMVLYPNARVNSDGVVIDY